VVRGRKDVLLSDSRSRGRMGGSDDVWLMLLLSGVGLFKGYSGVVAKSFCEVEDEGSHSRAESVPDGLVDDQFAELVLQTKTKGGGSACCSFVRFDAINLQRLATPRE